MKLFNEECEANRLDELRGLDPREVDRLLTTGRERWYDAWGHYRQIGPDHGDLDPMLLLAESCYWAREGDSDGASRTKREAWGTRILLVSRVAADIASVGPAC